METRENRAHVLIVEDDAPTARYIRDLLATLGHLATVARDGEEAVTLAVQLQPDLVLLDIRLPTVSGFDVCRRLKRHEDTRDIPVVMVTALSVDEAKVYSLQMGADDYITKPFGRQELASRIEARLRAKRREDALREKASQVRATFQRYVAPPVVEQLLQNPERVELGGRMQVLSVLFADLRGFSALATRSDPGQTVAILNQWLALAARAVLRHEGTLDKFLGDGLLALFNAPLAQPDHVERAARAALEIRAAIPHLQRAAEQVDLGFGIGICTGEALVGNIGTETLMNYTAIGAVVNRAKRLQEAAHIGQILLCAASHAALADRAAGQLRQVAAGHGGEDPIEAFELLDLVEPLLPA